jgi:quercetin dioxygenase-like cupin family protein
MKTVIAGSAAICLVAMPLAAQAPAIPTMDHEPHHHLVLHNDYVKVFNVEVAPGDSIILHSHDQDTVAIAIGDQLVTVGIPGKPDVHQKNADAQVRLQRSGYVHSTHVDGDTPYHTVAVELMGPQTSFHNLCAEILPGQPLNCPTPPAKPSPAYSTQPLLASAQTQVELVRVPPRQNMKVESARAEVIVALDAASIFSNTPDGLGQELHPGDFVWLAPGTDHGRIYQNRSDKDARFIQILFPQSK